MSIGGVELEKLYLKIDKRAIIQAESLTLHGGDTQAPDELSPTRLRQGFLALYLIEELTIDQIQTPQGKMRLSYRDGVLDLEHERLELQARIGWMEPTVALEIEQLTLPEHEAHASGRGFIDPLRGRFWFDGELKSPHLEGSFNLQGDRQKVELAINRSAFALGEIEGGFSGTGHYDIGLQEWALSGDLQALAIRGRLEASGDMRRGVFELLDANSKDLGPLAAFLPVPDEYRPWIHGLVLADHYEADRFMIAIDFETLEPEYEKIALKGFALDGSVRFHEALDPALIDRFEVTIDEDTLRIQTRGAEYGGQGACADLNIFHLTSNQRRYMELTIESDTLLDESIASLLRAYGLEMPIRQSWGENHTDLVLRMDLSETTDLIPTVQTRTDARNLQALLYGMPLTLSDLSVKSHDGVVTLEHARLYESGVATIEAKGWIDPGQEQLQLSALVESLQLLEGLGVDMHDLPLTLKGNWSEQATILEIPELRTHYRTHGDTHHIRIADLHRLRPHTPLMELFNLQGGQLELSFEGGYWRGRFDYETDHPLLYRNGAPILSGSGQFEQDEDGFWFSTLDGDLSLWQNADLLRARLNGVGIDAKALEAFYEENKERFGRLDSALQARQGDRQSPNRLFVSGSNNKLIYGDRRIGTDWFSLFMEGEQIEAQLREGGSVLMVSRKKSDVILRGERLGPRWINEAADMRMRRGSWDISAHANLNTADLYGVIRLRNASFGQARFVSNLIALVNTLPALVQFRAPGFSADGFEIERGVIEFYQADEMIFFNAIRLIGANTDIIGQGSIDLATSKVDFTFSVHTVKAASRIIGSIPIIGYILLGDDRAISTVLRVGGTLDKPTARSEALKDTAFYPLAVIGRTLTLPFKLFESDPEPID